MSLRRVLSIAAVLVAVMPGQAAAQKGQWKTLARTSDGHQTVANDTATMEGTPDPRVFLVTRRSVIEQNARDSSYGMIEGEKYEAGIDFDKLTGGKISDTQKFLDEKVFDLNFFKDGKIIWDKTTLAPVGAYWESLHPKNRWGGNFKSLVDCPHFERNVG